MSNLMSDPIYDEVDSSGKLIDATRALMEAVRNYQSGIAAGQLITATIASEHRTDQQTFWSTMLHAQIAYAQAGYDGRNAEAVALACAVKQLAEEHRWHAGLPRI